MKQIPKWKLSNSSSTKICFVIAPKFLRNKNNKGEHKRKTLGGQSCKSGKAADCNRVLPTKFRQHKGAKRRASTPIFIEAFHQARSPVPAAPPSHSRGIPPSRDSLTQHTASHSPARAPFPLTKSPPTAEHRCLPRDPSQPGQPLAPYTALSPPQARTLSSLLPPPDTPQHTGPGTLHQDHPSRLGRSPSPRTDLPALPSWAPLGQRLRGRPGRKCHRAASPAHRRPRTPQHQQHRLVGAPTACRDM